MNEEICALCGKSADEDDKITREHYPPLQFYPKSIRGGLNLWADVPTHKSCNGKNKLDEEYFYHATYPLVANVNSSMAVIILEDFKRRAKRPQTPALLRGILRTKKAMTPGGITLPPGVVRLDADEYRLQQVALKIGRCLFYRDHRRVMPLENCKDIRLCEREEDVPELYTLSWAMSKVSIHDLAPAEPGKVIVAAPADAGQAPAACRQVFDYRAAFLNEERLHLYSLRFWEAFMFCMAFQDPARTNESRADDNS